MNWIDASLTVPDNDDEVLITDGETFEVGRYCVDDEDPWSGYDWMHTIVTHWMKIELPKDEE